MENRIILADTSVIIDFLRKNKNLGYGKLRKIMLGEISSITLFELLFCGSVQGKTQ
jgi:predicted nucleic acid-binding protein